MSGHRYLPDMSALTRRIAITAIGLAGMFAVAAPQAGSASPGATPKNPCGFYTVDTGTTYGYWHNCNTIPERVHVYRYGGNDFEICVDATQTRGLGWVGGDWGGVLGADQVGRCPA